jgi:phosphoadenosine phosphosulfate reductase
MTVELETAPLADVLRWALATFGADLRVASSFGVEDMVVVHAISERGRELGIRPRVFFLDTGRLHAETYDLVDKVRDRYQVDIDVYFPEASLVEDLVRRKGPNSFYASVDARRECCDVRKVRPLGRALAGARAWMTGMRRAQSPTRADLRVLETDDAHGGIPKLSPLARWTEDEVWAFVREHRVPVHPLHAEGYPSIGCAPCTRAVRPGEDVRAGRWWWEDPAHKECGLHPRGAPARARSKRVAS